MHLFFKSTQFEIRSAIFNNFVKILNCLFKKFTKFIQPFIFVNKKNTL